VIVGCGGSTVVNKDATPTPADGSPKPDAGAEAHILPGDTGPLVTPDATPDDLPIAIDTRPIVTPDATPDNLPVAIDTRPIVTPDATPDNLPVAIDTRPIITPDATVNDRPVDAGPILLVDAAADGPDDTADGGDASGANDAEGGTDSLPIACEPFVGGIIVSDLTLTKACSPYIISDFIAVNAGAVLTIEPGVALRFADTVGIDVGRGGEGKLVAVGTATEPIIFTSDMSPPLPGDWRAIRLFDGTLAGTKIAYAKLDYCGADRNGCIVGDGLTANLVTLDNLTIGHVSPDADGILEYDAESNIVITNSTFNDIASDRFAISVQAPSFAGIGTSNTFNDGSMIEVLGGTVSSTTTWANPGTVIAVTDNLFVDGPDKPVLTLGPGVTLAFAAQYPATTFGIGNATGGKLVAVGTTSDHVVITSLASEQNQGDWVGIEVWPEGAAQFRYADISYAGSYGTSGGDLIVVNANSLATLDVDHSSFTYSLGYGIYLPCADTGVSTPLATVTLGAGVTFAHNESDMTDVNDQSHNVGPGLSGSNCPEH
jgi:hypothetical protein